VESPAPSFVVAEIKRAHSHTNLRKRALSLGTTAFFLLASGLL